MCGNLGFFFSINETSGCRSTTSVYWHSKSSPLFSILILGLGLESFISLLSLFLFHRLHIFGLVGMGEKGYCQSALYSDICFIC